MKKIIIPVLLLISFLSQNCYYDNEEDLYQNVNQEECTATEATFQADIVPMMLAYCNQCHRNDRQDGNVNLEGYNNIKTYADNGELYGTTNHDPGYKVMPTSGIKIPFCEIEKLRLWIEAGSLDN